LDQGRFFASTPAYLLRSQANPARMRAVLIAIFTDIHGNREALEACLAYAGRHPIDRYVFLGDFVGYGADPGFVIDAIQNFTSCCYI
jgi:hypothetical protein